VNFIKHKEKLNVESRNKLMEHNGTQNL